MQIIHPLKDKEARISSPFGMRYHPIQKKHKMHNGIDLAVPIETPIYAVVKPTSYQILKQPAGAGEYIKMLYKTPQGNEVGIYYMHLLKGLDLKDIEQGDLIGFTGNSGSSTGPHLHFGIQVNWKWVEPTQYIV